MKYLRPIFVMLVFWVALVICGATLARQKEVAEELLGVVGGLGLLPVIAAFGVMWVITVQAWRFMLSAWIRVPISFQQGARHLALLLIGKYLPGGFFGFASRHVDAASGNDGYAAFSAGLAEQVSGLAIIIGLGAIFMFWGRLGSPLALALFGLLPLTLLHGFRVASIAVVKITIRGLDQVRLAMRELDVVRLRSSILFTLAQHSIFLAVVGWLSSSAFDLRLAEAASVSGAYGIAVGVGMLAIFVPAGIFVREGVFVMLLEVSGQAGAVDSIALAAFLRLLNSGYDFGAGGAAWLVTLVTKMLSKG